MDSPRKCENQLRTALDSIVEEPFQVSWNRRIKNWLNSFIPKSMVIFNHNSEFFKLVIH